MSKSYADIILETEGFVRSQLGELYDPTCHELNLLPGRNHIVFVREGVEVRIGIRSTPPHVGSISIKGPTRWTSINIRVMFPITIRIMKSMLELADYLSDEEYASAFELAEQLDDLSLYNNPPVLLGGSRSKRNKRP